MHRTALTQGMIWPTVSAVLTWKSLGSEGQAFPSVCHLLVSDFGCVIVLQMQTYFTALAPFWLVSSQAQTCSSLLFMSLAIPWVLAIPVIQKPSCSLLTVTLTPTPFASLLMTYVAFSLSMVSWLSLLFCLTMTLSWIVSWYLHLNKTFTSVFCLEPCENPVREVAHRFL